tara:strand:+ start:16879 stop:17085 length:207 start_codon:yes stop_codon:yes gene_type:complete
MKLIKKEETNSNLLDWILFDEFVDKLIGVGISKVELSTTFRDFGRTLKQAGIRENLINKIDHDQSTQS